MTPLCMLRRRRVVHTRAQSFSWLNVANGLQSRASGALGPEEITLLDADAYREMWRYIGNDLMSEKVPWWW